ncbi:hypothetical protein [Sulfolobus super-elliptical virus]|nr:hypothetical protein [Sulfolobus super-elliptical virus]
MVTREEMYVLNNICKFLSEKTSLHPNEIPSTILEEFGLDFTLYYKNSIYNGHYNDYYYYRANNIILYVYYRDSRINYIEIRDTNTDRKICFNKIEN